PSSALGGACRGLGRRWCGRWSWVFGPVVLVALGAVGVADEPDTTAEVEAAGLVGEFGEGGVVVGHVPTSFRSSASGSRAMRSANAIASAWVRNDSVTCQ